MGAVPKLDGAIELSQKGSNDCLACSSTHTMGSAAPCVVVPRVHLTQQDVAGQKCLLAYPSGKLNASCCAMG